MNRRNFIKGLLAVGATFSVLPGAGRLWRVQRKLVPIVNPEWIKAPYEIGYILSENAYTMLGAKDQGKSILYDRETLEIMEKCGRPDVTMLEPCPKNPQILQVKEHRYPCRIGEDHKIIPPFIYDYRR